MDPEVPVIPRRRREDRPSGRLRKGMYILPSLFTTANIALGYYAILQVTHATAAEPWHFDYAAKAIGFAVLVRRSGWAHRAHDSHQQRFWPGARFAGRRHHLWRCSRAAGMDVGIPPVAGVSGVQRINWQNDSARLHRKLPVLDGRRQPSGALQHRVQSAAVESRDVRGRSILWECRFQRAPESSPQSCIFPAEIRFLRCGVASPGCSSLWRRDI